MLNAQFILAEHIAPKQWDDFVEQSPQGSLYARQWYLSAVMPGWGAIIVREGLLWRAVMPLRIRRKYGIACALQPAFSQYLGVLFAALSGNGRHIVHQKRLLLQALIAAIPSEIRLFSFNFSPDFDCFSPFLHGGFQINLRTNLFLSLQRPWENLLGDCSTSILNHLKKAQQNGLSCREGHAINVLSERMLRYHFIRTVAEKRSLETLWVQAQAKDKGFLLEIIGSNGDIQCSGLFLIEKKKCVFVASALDKEKRHLGANSLLILEAIKKCQQMGLSELDFKGSMLVGVEQFLWGFNPQQVLYWSISFNRLGLFENWVYRHVKRTDGVCPR